VAFEIDNEIRRLIDEAHDEALEILQGHREHLDRLATMLVERETMEREDVEAFLAEIPKRAQRDITVRGAGLAVSRRAIRTAGPPPTPGTIPPKPVG
jgi:cell division protease FtsH